MADYEQIGGLNRLPFFFVFKHFIINNLILNHMSVSTIKIETDLITLMKVLDKTGNPTVAIQILNGTYQEPEFCMADRASSPSKDGTREQYIFESYDIWTDIVHYKAPEHYWTREMSRAQWEKLDLWSDHVRRVMAEEILDEMDDVADTEQGF